MARSTYTITVILKAFFTGCRGQAKIFISEDIQTILDLENKISRVFGIKDFHLLSNENLLPSCEDIRLLEKGDIVCVLPNEPETNLLLHERFYSSNDETIKKKKRQNSDDDCPIKEKKCKKKRKEPDRNSNEKFHNLCKDKDKKNFKEHSTELKRKNNKNEVKEIVNNDPHQSLFCSPPGNIKNEMKHNVHIKKLKNEDKKDEENQGEQCMKICSDKQKNNHLHEFSILENKSLNVEKIKGDQCMIICSEEQKDMNQSNVFSSFKSISFFDDQSSTSFLKSTPKIKKTNAKLVSSINDSMNMIVDSSSSSESEIDKAVSRNSVSKTNEKLGKLKINKSTNEKSIDGAETQKKSCTLYCLPPKKKNMWTNFLPEKATNHVKINKVPISVLDIDLSRFVFNPCDVGVVPVPNPETAEEHIRNDVSSTDFNMANVSKSRSALPTEDVEALHLSACDKDKTEFNPNSSEETDNERETAEKIVQSSLEGQCITSSFIPESLKSENAFCSQSHNVVTSSDSKKENITKKSIVFENWRRITSNKEAQNALSNQEKPSNVLNEITEINENDKGKNLSNQSSEISSKIVFHNETENTLNKEKLSSVLNEIPKTNESEESKNLSIQPSELSSQIIPINVIPNHKNTSNEISESNECEKSKNVPNQLTEKISHRETQSQEKISTVLSEISENNKSENMSSQPLETSNVMKLKNNSHYARKQNPTNHIGINYYLKLLNKIDWDLSKSISNVNPDEIQSLTENEQLGKQENPQTENEMNLLENIDSVSVSSTVEDVTKRKRKRKHKKKVRADTPLPINRCQFPPSRQATLIKGAPKLHIRFETDENDYLEEEDDETSINFDKSSEKVKILQDVSLDLSMQNEENISNCQSFTTEKVEKINPTICISQNDSEDNLNLGGIESKDASLPSSINSSKLFEENEKIVSNKHVLQNLLDCINRVTNFESEIQKSALDYTNQNLTSYDKKNILSSSVSKPMLDIDCENEALAKAKEALLKAVGALAPEEPSNTKVNENICDTIEDMKKDV